MSRILLCAGGRSVARESIAVNELKQIADGPMGLDAMSELRGEIDLVAIAASDSFTRDEAAFFKVGDDSLHGSFRDPDSYGDFSQHHFRVLSEQDEDMGVIGEKGPLGPFGGSGSSIGADRGFGGYGSPRGFGGVAGGGG